MTYSGVHRAEFLSRPNRFLAECSLNGEKVKAHVRNTGRCRELLVPGRTVYLERNFRPGRKTAYTLVSVEKAGRIVNIDSLAPNRIFREAVQAGKIELPGMAGPCTGIRPETRYGDSRFDFYLENGGRKAFAEIKGVTLEEDGIVLFPDAPTQRGIKHIRGLCRAVQDGYLAYLVFIVQMHSVRFFTPNRRTHPEFGEAMAFAKENGVHLLAFDCRVAPDAIQADKEVGIIL